MTSTALAALHTPGQAVTDYTRRASSLQVGEAINDWNSWDRIALTAVEVCGQTTRLEGVLFKTGEHVTRAVESYAKVTVTWERTA